jgi:predicted nucleotidyltransferase
MATIAIDVDRDQLHAFCQKWKITEFALFGSVVRPDEFRDDSDVDVLVRFADDAGWSLLHMVDMKEELEAIFGRDVDLLSRRGVERSINPLRRESILGSAVQLDVA